MCMRFYWNLKWPPKINFLNICYRKKSNLIYGGDDIGLQSSCCNRIFARNFSHNFFWNQGEYFTELYLSEQYWMFRLFYELCIVPISNQKWKNKQYWCKYSRICFIFGRWLLSMGIPISFTTIRKMDWIFYYHQTMIFFRWKAGVSFQMMYQALEMYCLISVSIENIKPIVYLYWLLSNSQHIELIFFIFMLFCLFPQINWIKIRISRLSDGDD